MPHYSCGRQSQQALLIVRQDSNSSCLASCQQALLRHRSSLSSRPARTTHCIHCSCCPNFQHLCQKRSTLCGSLQCLPGKAPTRVGRGLCANCLQHQKQCISIMGCFCPAANPQASCWQGFHAVPADPAGDTYPPGSQHSCQHTRQPAQPSSTLTQHAPNSLAQTTTILHVAGGGSSPLQKPTNLQP